MMFSFKFWSVTACLAAILLGSGGHWYVLQSVAWLRMFADFAQHDSLTIALTKTFDGQHPCDLCLQIRQGKQTEQSSGAKLPWLKPEKLPELYCDAITITVPTSPSSFVDAPSFRQDPYRGFIESPPKPPPKQAAAAS